MSCCDKAEKMEVRTSQRITVNRARCLHCGHVVESRHGHEFVWCPCKSIAVDGGTDYLKRVFGDMGWEELSEFEEKEKESEDLGR